MGRKSSFLNRSDTLNTLRRYLDGGNVPEARFLLAVKSAAEILAERRYHYTGIVGGKYTSDSIIAKSEEHARELIGTGTFVITKITED